MNRVIAAQSGVPTPETLLTVGIAEAFGKQTQLMPPPPWPHCSAAGKERTHLAKQRNGIKPSLSRSFI